MPPESRVCTKCGLDKPLSEFSKAARGKYGRKASCKACDAARHAGLTADRVPKKRGRPRGAPIDPASPKTCTKCGVTKPHSEFSLARQATDTQRAVYRPSCKECQAAAARQWFRDHPERSAANRRRFNLEKNYGLSVEEYDRLLAEQGGVCAICGNAEPSAHGRTGKQFALSVDHCHLTGRVRGLLCQKCNRAIGLLGDDVDLLKKAIYYLEKGSGHNQ